MWCVWVFVFCTLAGNAHAAPPVITTTAKTTTFAKNSATDVELHGIGCTDADGDATNLTFTATPNTCGTCWVIDGTCTGGDTDCLRFTTGTEPPEGTYSFDVTCEADSQTDTATVTAIVTGATPVISNTQTVTTIPEDQPTTVTLATVFCVDAEDSTTIVFDNANPADCANCWEIVKCAPNECLVFVGGQGPPNVGDYDLTVRCDANLDSVTDVITVTVTSKPVITTTEKVASFIKTQATDLELQGVSCTDADGDATDLSLTVTPNSCGTCWTLDTACTGGDTDCLKFTPGTEPAVGSYSFSIVCTAGGDFTTTTVTVDVLGGPPVLTTTPITTTMKHNQATDLSLSTVECLDAEESTTVYVGTPTPNDCTNCWDVVTCGTAECLTFISGQGTPAVGTYDIPVLCTAGPDTVTEVVSITITSEPVLTVTPTTTSFPFDIGADQSLYTAACTDEDGDPTTVTIATNPTTCAACFVIQACAPNQCFIYDSAGGQPVAGTYTFTLQCESNGDTVTEDVTVTITSNPPVIAATPAQALFDSTTTTDVQMIEVTCTDPDGDATTIAVDSVESGSGCGTGCLTIQPCTASAEQCLQYTVADGPITPGYYDVVLSCTSGVNTVTTTVEIVVGPNPPTIDTYDKLATLTEGSGVNVVLGSITCSDINGDVVDTSVASLDPSGCVTCFEILDSGTAESLQYRAGVGVLQPGPYAVEIQCCDPGGLCDSEIVQVVVLPNAPPYFDTTSLLATTAVSGSATAGTTVYSVGAVDDNGDDITYSMSVLPNAISSFFEISTTTGEITTTRDLRELCGYGDVTFEVSIRDHLRTASRNLVVSTQINNPNTGPVALNLDRTVYVRELAIGEVVYDMVFQDDGNGNAVTYTATSANIEGLSLYNFDGTVTSIRTTGTPAADYENNNHRQTDVQIQLTDGFCTSQLYSLRLEVVDSNEEPEIIKASNSIDVCEGEREFSLGLTVNDPDLVDSERWEFRNGFDNTNGYFAIHQTSGLVRTLLDYDVEGNYLWRNGPHPASVEFNVRVYDKYGLFDDEDVTVNFIDCNDKYPVFDPEVYVFAATECSTPGQIGTVVATDDDLGLENDNIFTYSGSGGAVSVDTGGGVFLTSPLPAGTVITFEAYATDQGTNLNPLTSQRPAVISVRFTPCPTTQPPVTAAATTAAAAATTTTTTTEAAAADTSNSSSDDDNLVWIIFAALLGALMLGLLSFMLWRYWDLCSNFCSTRCKPKPKPLKPVKPVEPPRRGPLQLEREPTPEAPPPRFPGRLFGFWKETYQNEDHKTKNPNRNKIPEPGDMTTKFTHTVDPIEPPPPPPGQFAPPPGPYQAPPPAKAGCCIIL